MRWLNHERRIAVTGLAGSGKTVFLLSLLQHLEHFDPARFQPGGGAAVGAFRQLEANGPFAPFPRQRLRARLMERQGVAWPEKTTDIHQCRCSFTYSGLDIASRLWGSVKQGQWLSRRIEWDFLDFPGERLSDVLIAKHADFAQWSDELLELWDSYDRLRELTRGYLEGLAGSVPPTDIAVLDSYKHCLARMVHSKFQMITPSTFMLGHGSGDVLTAADLAADGRSRPSGLPGSEFAPLPRAVREANPGLSSRFAENYRTYRETVVTPLFAALNSCDTLLVLVDIPGLLSGGVGRYNDTNHLIETLAGAIVPSTLFTTNVDKLAFIATKADMVHAMDQDNMRELAGDMLRIVRNKQPGLRRYAEFVASAWVSAASVTLEDGSRALRGIPARGGDGVSRVFRIPELKAEWPADWGAEDPAYSFPRLLPPPLANRFMAPEQRNMDKVFDFIVR